MCVPADHGKIAAARGFTLIELVVGITLMAIVFMLLMQLIAPAVFRSAEPLVQQRAASLAESLMEEILSKRYDELTPEGGLPPCTTCSTILGADGETRANFDDVDDYNFYCNSPTPFAIINADDVVVAAYSGFTMRICVDYDGGYNGGATGQAAKRITVTITPPRYVPIVFTAYRANF
jgi:MSHA pilin protein MshD